MTAPTIPQIIGTLDTLRRMGLDATYPADLLTARRRAFVASIPSDPDSVDIETQPVSEQADERNSRGFPY
jgi:hypothetical protein